VLKVSRITHRDAYPAINTETGIQGTIGIEPEQAEILIIWITSVDRTSRDEDPTIRLYQHGFSKVIACTHLYNLLPCTLWRREAGGFVNTPDDNFHRVAGLTECCVASRIGDDRVLTVGAATSIPSAECDPITDGTIEVAEGKIPNIRGFPEKQRELIRLTVDQIGVDGQPVGCTLQTVLEGSKTVIDPGDRDSKNWRAVRIGNAATDKAVNLGIASVWHPLRRPKHRARRGIEHGRREDLSLVEHFKNESASTCVFWLVSSGSAAVRWNLFHDLWPVFALNRRMPRDLTNEGKSLSARERCEIEGRSPPEKTARFCGACVWRTGRVAHPEALRRVWGSVHCMRANSTKTQCVPPKRWERTTFWRR
jgi:hypothetical protein